MTDKTTIYHKFHDSSAIGLLSGILCAVTLFSSTLTVHATADLEARIAAQQAMPIQSNAIPNWPMGPTVTATSAILMDADSGAVLYAKNIHEKEFPASTTKILTCLLATENSSLDEVVSFSRDAVYSIPRDSSHIAMDAGEELTMEQSLNAILIASANEVSYAVAEHISGSFSAFADLMNQKARELGCVDSNFVNPNGLPDDNHYTSAYDLATIARAFFANELLCKISSTYMLHIPPSAKQPDDIVECSKNLLLPGRKYAYEYLVGSKTGYTDAARSTLVSCAEKDGMKLVCVVMRDESPQQFEDTVALFNYGFSNFDKINVSQTDTKFNIDNSNFFYSTNDVFGSSKPILSLNTQDCILLPKTASIEDTETSISYEDGFSHQAALINYTYQGQFIGSVSVDLTDDSNASYTFDEQLQTATEPQAEEQAAKSGGNVIFINIVKVLLWIIGIAALIIGVLFVRAFLMNYQFAGRDRNGRRSWKRRRSRSRSYSRPRERSVPRDRSLSKKKAKRPSRFRDYDF